jgi:hypothetical protein
MAEIVSVTPDNRIIVAGGDRHITGRPGYIKFWKFDTGELIRTDKWTHHFMHSLLTTPDSCFVVISGSDDDYYLDGTDYILIGNIERGEYQTVKQGHDFSIRLFWTWDKEYVLFGEYIWDWRKGGNPLPKRHSDPLIETRGKILLTDRQILESTDEGFIVEEFDKGIIRKISANHDNKLHRFSPMKVTPDGRYILSQKGDYSFKNGTSINNATLAMWDLKTGNLVKTFENCKSMITSLDITTDGQYAIVLTFDESGAYVIKVLEIETGKLMLSINPEQ